MKVRPRNEFRRFLKMEKYNFSKEIGSGSFGKVYLIESRQTGIQYVLKQIDLRKLDKKRAKSASKEVEVLSKLKHFHIVRYKESYESSNHLNIIMEYCENGDLHKKIKDKRMRNECFADNEIFDYFVQICLAIEYIHEQKILHRDIKTKNIFLTKGNLVKLGDFGVAKVLENSFELASTCIGSPYYISPEICENKPYNKKSDIWALGCVLYELSTLKYAFVAKNVKILISKISSGTFNPLPTNINTQIRSLLINLLKPNPKDRPTASEILSKPFLQKFKFKYSNETNWGIVKKRSSSGDNSKKCLKLNNQVKILSSSCTKLNDFNGKNKLTNITLPEMKYSVSFFSNKLKYLKRHQPAHAEIRLKDGDKTINLSNNTEKKIIKEDIRVKKDSDSVKPSKLIKIPTVDSEYYNLIAESNRSQNESGKIQDGGNKISEDNFSCEINKIEPICDRTITHEESHDSEEKPSDEEVQESRRRWMANTLDKEQLLTILSEAELLDITALKLPMQALDKSLPMLTVDDMLKLDPSEMSEDVLKPISVDQCIPDCSRKNESYLNLLKEEIGEIKAIFEANNKNFDVEDLMKLTETSKKIIKEEISRKYSGDDSSKSDAESIYFDLELKRMQLEKTVGLNMFLMTYRKMMDILNDNIQTDKGEESVSSTTDTYVIQDADGHKKPVEATWMAIIEAFGSKQEYIPDIWECAVRESLYYYI